MTQTTFTQTLSPDALPADFEFAGEWAVEADGKLLALVKDNGHTADAVARTAGKLELVREAQAAGAGITVRALSVHEFQSTCDHTFLASDGECWRCGAQVDFDTDEEI